MSFEADFFQFCTAREKLRISKDVGVKFPQSDDFVMNHWRFTNIFREDDTRTKWFNRHIRGPLSEDPELLVQACVAFRWFDSIPAGQILAPYLRGDKEWLEPNVSAELRQLPHVIHKTSPAARISAENRIPALLQAIRPFATHGSNLGTDAEAQQWDLQKMHNMLCKSEFMPPRLAYEVVCDLRHTCVLAEARDMETWALVTPEIAYGMGFVMSDCPGEFLFGHDRTSDAVPDHMINLLDLSHDRSHWPSDRQWEMSEVYNALNNFYYYRCAQRGEPAFVKYPLKQ